jgi:hypothetical protein
LYLSCQLNQYISQKTENALILPSTIICSLEFNTESCDYILPLLFFFTMCLNLKKVNVGIKLIKGSSNPKPLKFGLGPRKLQTVYGTAGLYWNVFIFYFICKVSCWAQRIFSDLTEWYFLFFILFIPSNREQLTLNSTIYHYNYLELSLH